MNIINRKSFLGLVAGSLLSLASCDVMDLDPTGWYGEDVTYSSIDKLDLYVKGLYGVMYSNADIANGYIMDDGVSELVKYSWWGDKGQVNRAFYDPNYVTVTSNYRSNWSSMYTHIRTLNEYFYDISQGYGSDLDQEAVKIRTAEVRFLRAYAYQELVIRHGGVVLRIEEDYVDGPEERAKARSSKNDCWDFILSEYTKAAADLPLKWDSANTGRITRGAAIAMKARAALYAERWSDAVDAVDDVMELNQYSLLPGTTYNDYNRIFTNPTNSELILPVYFQQSTGNASAKQHMFNSYFCAPGDDVALGIANAGVGVTATPSDEWASMFDIKVNGEYQTFDWADLDAYGNEPFLGREPRFYSSILYNGASWLGRTLDLTVESDNYMDWDTSGQDNVHKTVTGYVFRKYLSDSKSINFTSILSGQYWIEMRLAELYLIRSEANARQMFFDKAYADLNTIRTRVGLPEAEVKGDWDSYLVDLSKERACELGLEGHRYFDLVRWGIADETLNNTRLHGIRMTKNDDGTINYERVECDSQDRLFPARMGIYPIPYSELQNNTLCEQNPEWL